MAPEVLLGQGYGKQFGRRLGFVYRFSCTNTNIPVGWMSVSLTGASADFWSLGILMFEMFCGFTPFADEEDLEEDAIYMRIIQEDLSVRGQAAAPEDCVTRET